MPLYANFEVGQLDYIDQLNLMVSEINDLSGSLDTSITAAASSAASASTQATAASNSASNASAYANAASTSASAASLSETKASQWADHPLNTVVPGTASYSAKHWALSGANITYKGTWNATTYPTSPIVGNRYVIAPSNVTIEGTPYLAGESIVYNGSTWDKVPITDSSIPPVSGGTSGYVLSNNGTTMNWSNNLTSITLTTPTLSGTITSTGSPTVDGITYFKNLRIKGNSTGDANVATIEFYESNGTVRKGFIGDGSGANSLLHIYSDVSNVWITEQGGAVQGRVWHAGNDGPGTGLDADTLDTLQATSFVRTDASSTIADSYNLSFGSTTRQMINIWGTTYGIGAQASTMYFRTATGSAFAWHRGGTHSNTQFDSGGGTLAMKLDSSSNLTVTGNVIGTTLSGTVGSFGTLAGITSTAVVANLNASKVAGYGLGTTGNTYIPYVNANGECLIGTSDQGAYQLQVGGTTYLNALVIGSGYNVRGTKVVVSPTNNTTVANGDHVVITTASININLPTEAQGVTVYFTNRSGGTFTITPTSNIHGESGAMTFDITDSGTTVGLRYVTGGTAGWILI